MAVGSWRFCVFICIRKIMEIKQYQIVIDGDFKVYECKLGKKPVLTFSTIRATLKENMKKLNSKKSKKHH